MNCLYVQPKEKTINNDMITTILTSVELSSKVLELNYYYEPQQAAWWFIPAIVVAVIGLFSIMSPL